MRLDLRARAIYGLALLTLAVALMAYGSDALQALFDVL